MKEYIQVMWTSAIALVVAQVIFFGGSLQPSNLVLWAIIGMALGAIGKVLDLLFGNSEPEPSFLDKIADHPVALIVEGTVTGLIVGTSIGSYGRNEIGGCMIGGIIGLILSIILVFKNNKSE